MKPQDRSQVTQSLARTFGLGIAVACSIALAPAAGAALAITNGNFEDLSGFVQADPGTSANVTGWYSVTTGSFWQNTWHDTRDPEVPTDLQSGFSGEGAAAFSGAAGGGQPSGTNGSWLYQSIGTADVSITMLPIRFDWGDFGNINGGTRDLGMTVSVYESNGTFVAGNNTDVNGASGVTLLDSVSLSMAAVSGPSKLVLGQVANLDLTGHTGGELFLRFNNWDAGADTPWLMLDNVAIVPEPSVALLGGLGILGLLRRRRN